MLHLSHCFSCPMSYLYSELFFYKVNDKFGSIPATHRNKIIRPGTSISFPYLNIFFSSRLTLNKIQINVFILFLLSLADNKTSLILYHLLVDCTTSSGPVHWALNALIMLWSYFSEHANFTQNKFKT